MNFNLNYYKQGITDISALCGYLGNLERDGRVLRDDDVLNQLTLIKLLFDKAKRSREQGEQLPCTNALCSYKQLVRIGDRFMASEPVTRAIAPVRDELAQLCFNAVNGTLRATLCTLSNSTKELAGQLQSIFQRNRSQCGEAVLDMESIASHFEQLKTAVFTASQTAFEIAASLDNVKLTGVTLPPSVLNESLRLTANFFKEFQKVFKGIAHHQESNDELLTHFKYESHLKRQRSQNEIERNREGNPRPTSEVVAGYGEVLDQCLADLNDIISQRNVSVVNLLEAYNLLKWYVLQRERYVESRMPFLECELMKSGAAYQNLLVFQKQNYPQLRCEFDRENFNRHLERVNGKLDLLKDEIAVLKGSEAVETAQAGMAAIQNHPEYGVILDKKFKTPVRLKSSHWLVASMELHSKKDVQRISELFNRFDKVVTDLDEDLKKFVPANQRVSMHSAKPFMELEARFRAFAV